MELFPVTAASTDHVAHNEQHWDETSESYQLIHASQLHTAGPTWSVFDIPDAELGLLGDVAGLDVVELGCGGAQFSIALARQGARCTAIDISHQQLAHARALLDEAERADDSRPDVMLVHGDVEASELPSSSFDLAVSDYGASMFADPLRWVPEAARVLRPGGRLVFSAITPILELCWHEREPVSERMVKDYFGMHRVNDRAVLFNLPYGEWVRLFRRSGFDIVDLVETRPRDGVKTTAYRSANQVAWARRWPAEMIWELELRG